MLSDSSRALHSSFLLGSIFAPWVFFIAALIGLKRDKVISHSATWLQIWQSENSLLPGRSDEGVVDAALGRCILAGLGPLQRSIVFKPSPVWSGVGPTSEG